MADSAPPSPLYSPVSVDAAYTIRHLSSADIPAVRQLHRALVPHPLPPAFFHQLLVHPTRLCLVAVPTPSSSSSSSSSSSTDPAPAPTPVAFISAALHAPTNDLAPSRPPSKPQPPTQRAPAPTPALEAHILTLGVARAHRRRGLASRLVRAAVRALRAQAALSALVPRAHAYAGGSYFPLGSGSGSGSDEEEGEEEDGAESEEGSAKAGMLVTAHLASFDGDGDDADAEGVDGDAGARAFWARLGVVEGRDAKVGVAPRVGGPRAGVRVEGRVRA